MAEIDLIKISELPATSTIGDADELAVVQGGATKKVPYSVLKAGAEVTPDTTLSEAGVPADAAAVGAALAQKANQAAVTQALAAKADKSEVTDISGDIAELASVVETKADQTALNQKADKTTTDALRQDLTTLNGIVNQKADKTELNTQIGNVTAELATKANTADVNNRLAAKADIASPVFTGRPQAPTAPKGTATLQLATTAFVQNAIDDKEDKLTFDTAPTQGSTNPVTSGGVYTAVESAKADAEEAATEAKNLALGAYATPTASGSLLTLTDGADGIPAKKLTLSLSPHQSGSGDPSPDNVRSISGYNQVTVTRAGKNILPNTGPGPEYTRSGVTFTKNADGTVAAAGTADGTATYRWITQADSYTLPQGTYKVIFPNAPSGVSVAWGTTDGESGYWDNGTEFTLTHTVTYSFIALRIANSTTVDATFSIAICSASFTDDTYEPYNGTEYDITIPTAAGTVYGGSLEINEDGSGPLTVDRWFVNFTGGSNEEWAESDSDYYCRYRSAIFDGKRAVDNSADLIGNRFIGSRTAGLHTGTSGVAIRKNAMPSEVTSLAEWVAWLGTNNVEVVYPLATPQTYTLTAEQVTTLLGDNTLWMDADGSIDLTYRADTEKYVERRIAEVQALVLENNG